MAYTEVATGQTVEASHHNEIVKSLNGTSGYGQAVALTQLNDGSNYALDVRNLDSANGYAVRVRDEADNVIATFTRTAVNLAKNLIGGAQKWFINDNANAKMTVGLTINQGGNDDEILALKSSDVEHGITDYAETDTFATFKKDVAATGGLRVRGYTAATVGVGLSGYYVTADATKTGVARAAVEVDAWLKDGSDLVVPAANTNLFAVRGGGVARFIVDYEGDILYDGTAGAYDEYDDAAAVRDLARVVSKREHLTERYNKEHLKAMGVLHESGDGRVFVSHKSKDALMQGAIAQMYERVRLLEQQVHALKADR